MVTLICQIAPNVIVDSWLSFGYKPSYTSTTNFYKERSQGRVLFPCLEIYSQRAKMIVSPGIYPRTYFFYDSDTKLVLDISHSFHHQID